MLVASKLEFINKDEVKAATNVQSAVKGTNQNLSRMFTY